MSNSNPMDENPVTFTGLEEWNKRLFEKFGWMYLAKSHITSKNNELRNFGLYKIKMYKKEVKFLGLAIINKYNSITETEKKEDLKILMKNNLVLQEAVANLLESINNQFPKITPAMLDSDVIQAPKKKSASIPSSQPIDDMDDILYNMKQQKPVMRNKPTETLKQPNNMEEEEAVKKNIYQIYNDIKRQKEMMVQQNDIGESNFIGGGKKTRKTSKNVIAIPEKIVNIIPKQTSLKTGASIKKSKKL